MKYAAASSALFATTALAITLSAQTSEAHSFVTLHDDGTMAAKITTTDPITAEVVKLYDATKSPRPDVISVWTNFNIDDDPITTLFDPISSDVKGIGLDDDYGGDGTFQSTEPPIRAILLHNNFTTLDTRAKTQGAPTDQFSKYIFLLELTHLWGPALRVPVGDAGTDKDELIGFPFHWSFWMNATGSPAGGNAWIDNGDGSFTSNGQLPKDVRYSMLDLYMMGLADPSEVPAFGVLENVTPPAMTDPLIGGPYSKESFPWFGSTPFTVKATQRNLTIADIVAANGTRTPTKSSGDLKLGIVLMVSKDTKPEDVAELEDQFDAIADSLAPAFSAATMGRGTMTVVTSAVDPVVTTDAGAGDAGAIQDAPGSSSSSSSSGGCDVASATSSNSGTGTLFFAGTAILIALGLRGKKRLN